MSYFDIMQIFFWLAVCRIAYGEASHEKKKSSVIKSE
jgi:hypothetical protein